jgi:protein-disulfide isomerase
MTPFQEPAAGRSGWRSALDLVATFAIIGAAVTMMVRSATPAANGAARPARPEPELPKQPVALAGVPFVGARTAKVTMLEFSDFQCPFCARFVKDVLPALKTKYIDTGIMQMGFRHNPLPIHNRAQRVAESTVCALNQERFWPMHDALFSKPDQKESLEDEGLEEAAAAAGLNVTMYRTCMAIPPTERVKEDAKLAGVLGLTGTPAFAVGVRDASGQLVVKKFVLGAQAIENFTAAIEGVAKGN